MKKFIFIVLCFALYLSISGCQKTNQAYLSNWPVKTPVIDGQLDEWQLPLEQPSAQIGIKYRCSNDAQFLYLAVQVPDEYMKALMLHQGATIWIDTTGRKRDKVGFGFPIPLKEAEIEDLMKEANGNEAKFMLLYAEALQEFDLIGLAEEPLRASNLTSKDLKVAAGFDQIKGFLFEMRIPFKQIYGRMPNLTETLGLGIQINTPKKTLDDDNNDGGLFNDRNATGVTQSNPLMGPNPNQQQFTTPNRQPSMPNLWMKIKLKGEG